MYPLIEKQDLFDKIIYRNFRVNKETLDAKRTLAIHTELSELMNEWEGFKFWKKKKKLKGSKQKQLEEYADGFHFILSFMVDLIKQNPHLKHYIYDYPSRTMAKGPIAIIQQALDLHGLIYALNNPIPTNHTKLLQEYMNLGYLLGFTWDEIVKSFLKTNEKNIHRQKVGY